MAETKQLRSIIDIDKINIAHLPYIERDLSYDQKISLAFLLFGNNHANAVCALQKLLQLNRNAHNSDLLHQYAYTNPKYWRHHLTEALCIINARKVLRKLGLNWYELSSYYLPEINALTINIDPVIKTLYKLCENLKQKETKKLILYINKRHIKDSGHLSNYDFEHLEIFLLDWLTRHIIKFGTTAVNSINAASSVCNKYEKCDLNALEEYFKLNDSDSCKNLTQIVEVINLFAHKYDSIEKRDPTYDIEDMHQNYSQYASLVETDCYNVRSEHAGIALIINQEEFHRNVVPEMMHLLPKSKLQLRTGTNVDSERLTKTFQTFGYKIELLSNLESTEVLHNIRDVVKRSQIFDSLIVCILSHGIDGMIYGSNSLPVKISDIEHIMSEAKILLNKPKMLIIQACQKVQQTQSIPKSNSKVVLDAASYADLLKAMSTVPGYESVRHTKMGTWFIQALCDAIDKYGKSKHMLDILTAVTSDVSKKRGSRNEIMIPSTSTTLRKTFYLPH